MRRQRTIYDRNGNLTYESTARKKADGHYEPAGMERKLLWDEENRLTALSENGYVSAYVYDADGERTVKMHGGGSASYRNAADSAVTTARPKYTLYASPYFMRDEQGNYLKHIYIGSDRIVSQVVRGSWASDNNPKGGTIANFVGLMTQSKYKAKKDSLQSALNQRYADLQVPFKGVDRDSFIYNSNPAQARANIQQSGTYESQQYFYHKDHLGSSTIITTLDGTITQHVQYIPYGEVFIEQQNEAEWSSPFRFTGKELDEETGLYYFGARYFDPKNVNWLSTDPLENNHPNMFTYAFCGGNPVNYKDIWGLDSIYWNQDGVPIGLFGTDKSVTHNFVVRTMFSQKDIYPTNNPYNGWINSINEDDYYATIEQIRKGNYSSSNIVYVGTTQQLKSALSLIGDDGNGGSSDNNNREYAGDFSKRGKIVNFRQGPVGNPSKSDVVKTFGDANFHSHPSGAKMKRKYLQPPSSQDIRSAKGTEIVFGMRSRIIYIYDKQGVKGIFPMRNLNIKR